MGAPENRAAGPAKTPAKGHADPLGRFIPREELGSFAAWQPGSFGDDRPARAADEAAELEARVQAARQAGYQDGYRDGLVALDNFKHSFAAQMTAQLGALVSAFDAAFAQLEAQIATSVAASATALSRQVVRSELAARPELVATVAAQAVEAVLLSARHIRVHVHPEDLPLVQQGASDALAARGARLVADAAISRGGCRVDSDLGRIDATIEQRWSQAAAALGQDLALHDAASRAEADVDAGSAREHTEPGYHGVLIGAAPPPGGTR